MASRLKVVITSVVSQAQRAFLQGRSIIDGSLCANECIDSRICNGILGVLSKTDMEKAYYHVSWGFLLVLLWKHGFRVKWRN